MTNEEYLKGFYFMALIHLFDYEVSDLKDIEHDQLKEIFDFQVDGDVLDVYLMDDDGNCVEYHEATSEQLSDAYDAYVENNFVVLRDMHGVSSCMQFCDCHISEEKRVYDPIAEIRQEVQTVYYQESLVVLHGMDREEVKGLCLDEMEDILSSGVHLLGNYPIFDKATDLGIRAGV